MPALQTALVEARKYRVKIVLGTQTKRVWHDLPATFGTRLGEAGYDAFTIAALMGHSQIQTTARYARATERNKLAAVEAVILNSEGGYKLDTTQNGQVRWPL